MSAADLLPTFLIIGAAKCGTTSLYQYLRQHPDIYVSPIKEPKYFALAGERLSYGGPGDQEDIERHSIVASESYRQLFRGAREGQAVGEASTLYLYHPSSARRIRNAIPGVKLVAILRDPAERAYSNFLYMIRRGNEPLRNFAEALAAEDERVEQQWMPTWHYRRRGLYAQQLRRYYGEFGRDQLRVYLHEDLVTRPAELLRDLFRFLEVEDTFSPDVSLRHNVSGMPKSERLHRFLLASNRARAALRPWLPRRMARPMARRLRTWNLSKAGMPPDVRRRLVEFYRDDIRELEGMIGRDLSRWLM